MTSTQARAIRKGLVGHRRAVNIGECSGRKPYQPHAPELRAALEEQRLCAAGRQAEMRERRRGIDLDARAEQVWAQTPHEDREQPEFPLPECLQLRSWWPRLVDRLERAGYTYGRVLSAQTLRTAHRRKLRELFGPEAFPVLPRIA